MFQIYVGALSMQEAGMLKDLNDGRRCPLTKPRLRDLTSAVRSTNSRGFLTAAAEACAKRTSLNARALRLEIDTRTAAIYTFDPLRNTSDQNAIDIITRRRISDIFELGRQRDAVTAYKALSMLATIMRTSSFGWIRALAADRIIGLYKYRHIKNDKFAANNYQYLEAFILTGTWVSRVRFFDPMFVGYTVDPKKFMEVERFGLSAEDALIAALSERQSGFDVSILAAASLLAEMRSTSAKQKLHDLVRDYMVMYLRLMELYRTGEELCIPAYGGPDIGNALIYLVRDYIKTGNYGQDASIGAISAAASDVAREHEDLMPYVDNMKQMLFRKLGLGGGLI